MNHVILMGRLGRDPETRTTQSGKKVATLSLATTEKFSDKEQTEWHRLIIWDKQAEIAEKYLSKGSRILVEGAIRYREYEKDGVKRQSTEINVSKFTMLDPKPSTQSAPANGDLPF